METWLNMRLVYPELKTLEGISIIAHQTYPYMHTLKLISFKLKYRNRS
jgi:hypothetical protein